MTKRKAKVAALAIQEPEPEPMPVAEPQQRVGMTKEELDARFATVQTQEAPPERRTKVAILGFTETWRLAPFQDPDFEIWGLNELYMFIPRWDRWFEIHDRAIYQNDRNRTHEHILRLQQMTCPIYMQQHWDDIPASVPYPLQAMSQMFPNPCPEALPYYNNSISYMLALAIAEGFKEIHIYGVDMSHDTEYMNQRPSCEYFIGIAQGMGIKLYIPSEADLLKTPFLYGFQQQAASAFDRELTEKENDMQNKFNQATAQLQQMVEQRAAFMGALQHVQHMRKNWRSYHTGMSTSK